MTGMIEWRQKSNPKKIPKSSDDTQKKSLDQKITPKKINYTKAAPRHFGSFLIPQKNPRLNRATQKILAKFSYPKKIPESKIANPQNSFHHPRHFRSEVTPPHPRWGLDTRQPERIFKKLVSWGTEQDYTRSPLSFSLCIRASF